MVDWQRKTPIKKQGKAECCHFLLLCIQAQCLRVMEFCRPEPHKDRALMRRTQPNDDERAVSHRHRQLNSGLKSDCGGGKNWVSGLNVTLSESSCFLRAIQENVAWFNVKTALIL